jgi:hypothetical protein
LPVFSDIAFWLETRRPVYSEWKLEGSVERSRVHKQSPFCLWVDLMNAAKSTE